MIRPFTTALAVSFLLANLVLRGQALLDAGGWHAALLLAATVVSAAACAARPALVAPALQLFATSFFLYGFHSYRPANQVFEFLVCAFALVLLVRLVWPAGGRPGSSEEAGAGRVTTRMAGGGLATLALAYGLLATGSLLLLPATVLEHRVFLEGVGFAGAALGAFPKDPLYPIASVNRLWLFVLFAGLVATQPDNRVLFRRTFRGVALAAMAAIILGLMDFAGLLPLERYNLSTLFYGRQYRRLQSTFGNPSWFACFVACALPFVWLEFRQARGRVRLALAVVFPLCAAGLFLSGARAAWLAGCLFLAGLALAAMAARRVSRALPVPDAASRLAFGLTVLTVAALGTAAWTTPLSRDAQDSETPPGRLDGLSRELHYRGLGLRSPRRVAAQYALELARLNPLFGLGHESFNFHLRTQLEIPDSGVAKVVNTALEADARESVFDDSHNTYLQVLTGTGAVGLTLWLAIALAGIRLARRADPAPEALAVLLGLAIFHFYGLFQGMAYIPVTFLLLPLLMGHALALAPDAEAAHVRARRHGLAAALALLVATAWVVYASDNGYASLKRRFGVAAYLPDEAEEFEGFYRAEAGPTGEFRWMRERAIVNIARARPFLLRFTCEHPDAEREPIVLRLRFEGRDAGQVVFRRPGAIDQRFDFGAPGALRLTLSRTFTPASGADRRELGIAVSAIRWE